MADSIKVLSSEISLSSSTANTVSLAQLVRVVNTDGTNAVLITKKDASDNVIGTLTLGNSASSYGVEHLIKQPTDTLTANINSVVKAVSIGFY